MPSSVGETGRPPSRAPSHLQDVPGSAKGLKRSYDLRDLPIPFLGQVRTSVVAAAALPPLVILGRTSSVIRSLLREEPIVVHWQSLSVWDGVDGIERHYVAEAVSSLIGTTT
jgi:hypothetical protein